jgi:hypothetical protein
MTLKDESCPLPLPVYHSLSLLCDQHEVGKFALPHALAAMLFCLKNSLQQWNKPTMD